MAVMSSQAAQSTRSSCISARAYLWMDRPGSLMTTSVGFVKGRPQSKLQHPCMSHTAGLNPTGQSATAFGKTELS